MKKTFEGRDYQWEMLEGIDGHPFVFVKMPTGTGKTYTALQLIAGDVFMGETFVSEGLYWLAPQQVIRDQAWKTWRQMNNLPLLSEDGDEATVREVRVERNVAQFSCWQSFRDRLNDLPIDPRKSTLVLDETHTGSSGLDEDSCASFRKILERPWGRILALSATPWELNKGVYGIKKRRWHQVTLSQLEAVSEGYIHDVEVVRVDCGLNFDAGSDVRIRAEDVVDGAEQALEEGIDIRGARDLFRERCIQSLIRVVKNEEPQTYPDGRLRPVMFICKDIEEVEHVAGKIAKTIVSDRVGHALVRTAHSKLPGSQAEDNMRAFQRGEFLYLVTAEMGREGFDVPELVAAVDLTAKPRNSPRRVVQVIGRACRKAPGKDRARYYYVRTPVDAIRVNGVSKELDQPILDHDVTYAEGTERDEETEAATREAIEDHLLIQTANEREAEGASFKKGDDPDIVRPIVETKQILGDDGRKITVTRSRLLREVTAVGGRSELKTVKLSSVLRTVAGSPDSASRKKAILEFLHREGRWPRTGKSRKCSREEGRLGDSLVQYTQETSSTYDPDFRAECIRLGLVKKSKTGRTASDVENQIWAFFEKHGRFPKQTANDSLERALAISLNGYKSGKSFRTDRDPTFLDLVREKGHGSKFTSEYFEEQFAVLRQFHKDTNRLPSAYTQDVTEKKLSQWLYSRCTPSSQSFRSEVREWAVANGYGVPGTKGHRINKKDSSDEVV